MKTHRFGSKRNPGLKKSVVFMDGQNRPRTSLSQPTGQQNQHEMSDWNITRPSLEI